MADGAKKSGTPQTVRLGEYSRETRVLMPAELAQKLRSRHFVEVASVHARCGSRGDRTAAARGSSLQGGWRREFLRRLVRANCLADTERSTYTRLLLADGKKNKKTPKTALSAHL